MNTLIGRIGISPHTSLGSFVNGVQQSFSPDFRWLDKFLHVYLTLWLVHHLKRGSSSLENPVPHVLTWSGAERNSVNRVGADYHYGRSSWRMLEPSLEKA